MASGQLSIVKHDQGWVLAGDGADGFALVNDYLAYLVDRNYSPRTVRSYANGLLAFCRWLTAETIALDAVTTDVMLRFLAACRHERVVGRAGPNVVRMDGTRARRARPGDGEPAVGGGVGVVHVPVDASTRNWRARFLVVVKHTVVRRVNAAGC